MSTAGCPDSTVRGRAATSVRAVIRNSGLEFPIDRIAVNLAPTCSGSGLRLVRSGDERKHFMSKRLKGEKKS